MRFVFTHRGMHGGWCWKYLLEELAALGLSAIAPDLRGHGERANEPVTLDGYRDALLDVLESDDVLTVVEHQLPRLGPTTIHPAWASHSPLISRPKELARQLVTIAAG
jgi:pimeloyl-ACP methyl ester carboxylesterase